MNAKKIFFAGVCLLAACFTQAQESQMPKAFSYQAVVRNSQGKVIAKQPVGIKVEILQGSTEGSVVYAETQTPESSQTGTVNLLIGTGTATQGVFADIDWGAATYFLRISMDLQGGSSYEVVSTTQMLPVPYALYAEKAGSVVNGGSGGSTEPGTPADGTVKYGRDFIIISENAGDLLYKLFANELSMNTPNDLYIGIMYCTGTDLQLKVEIPGYHSDYETSSSTYGHFYRFYVNDDWNESISNGSFSSSIIVKDSNGNKLWETPFSITIESQY